MSTGGRDLLAEERRVAGEQPVGAGRVDRLLGEDADEDRAEIAADAVGTPHTSRASSHFMRLSNLTAP